MQKAIRVTAVIYMLLSSILATFCFGVSIACGNQDFVQFLKDIFPYLFRGTTAEEQVAIVASISSAFIFGGIQWIAGIVFDFLIYFKAKPETGKPICIVFGSLAILLGQLVPGILFVIYTSQKTTSLE